MLVLSNSARHPPLQLHNTLWWGKIIKLFFKMKLLASFLWIWTLTSSILAERLIVSHISFFRLMLCVTNKVCWSGLNSVPAPNTPGYTLCCNNPCLACLELLDTMCVQVPAFIVAVGFTCCSLSYSGLSLLWIRSRGACTGEMLTAPASQIPTTSEGNKKCQNIHAGLLLTPSSPTHTYVPHTQTAGPRLAYLIIIKINLAIWRFWRL